MEQTVATPVFPGRGAIEHGVAPVVFDEQSTQMISGREQILAARPMLAAIARRTCQAGETDSLSYILSTPAAARKIPHLLLIPPVDGASGHGPSAVFVFEYKALLGGSRIFATEDASGRRNVLARPGMRAHAAAFAARTLIQRGAQIVHLAFSEMHRSSDDGRDPETGLLPGVHAASGRSAGEVIAAEFRARRARRIAADWALNQRECADYLPLLPTLDATLARIGRKTRTNLRYYRRRCEQSLGARFVANARPSLNEFLQFNRGSAYAVPDDIAAARHEAALTEPTYCIRGVVDGDGQWLSMVGIRRHNGFVEMDWQMNRADLPAQSLATVMRSFLIDYEIEQGSTRLYLEGGTPQAISRAFLRHTVTELTVARRSAYVGALERFSPFVLPPKNYIRHILSDPNLHWKPW